MRHKRILLALVLVIGLLAVGVQAQEPLNFGQQVEGSIDSRTPQVVYSFSGEKGQTILIKMNSEDFDSYLVLTDTEGNEVAYDDDNGGYPNAQIGPLLLVDSGDYQIIAKSVDNTAQGDFVLELQRIEVTVLNYGETMEAALTPETAVLYFRFDAKKGRAINLRVDSGGELDTRIIIRNTADSQVATDDDSGTGNDPFVSNFIVPDDDVYIAAIEPYSAGLTGTLKVSLWESDLPSLDNGPQTVTISEEAYRQALTFEGKAGEQVQITLQFADNAAEFMTVHVTQGELDITNINGSGLNNLSFGLTTPEDGRFFVIIDNMYFSTESSLSAEVSLERLPAAAQ